MPRILFTAVSNCPNVCFFWNQQIKKKGPWTQALNDRFYFPIFVHLNCSYYEKLKIAYMSVPNSPSSYV